MKSIYISISAIAVVFAQVTRNMPPDLQKSCSTCLDANNYVCKLGGYSGESDAISTDFAYTGYSSSELTFASGTSRSSSKCCKYFWNCDIPLTDARAEINVPKLKNENGLALCSNKAATNSMKYTFCDYNQAACMSSQSLLTPSYDGRQMVGSAPNQFYSGSSCYWKIGAPGEWTTNSVIKILVKKLKNSECFINHGGSQTSTSLVMTEKACTVGETYEFKYGTDFSFDANIFVVSWATYGDEAKTVDQFGSIELEYWVENVTDYPSLVNKGFLYFLIGGVILCFLMIFLFKQGIQESLENDVKLKVWKLLGKPKEYVMQNAPTVMEMVSDAERAMEQDPTGKLKKKTKEMLLKELKNDLEEPWCCVESLAPVNSVGLAFALCACNVLVPGLGTALSGCCVKSTSGEKKPKENKIAADNDEDGLDSDEDDEAKAKRLEEEKKKAEEAARQEALSKIPQVVSTDKKIIYSASQAFITGFGQLLSAPFGLGWIWSISHGLVLVENAQLYALIQEVELDKDGIYGGKKIEEKKEDDEDDDAAF